MPSQNRGPLHNIVAKGVKIGTNLLFPQTLAPNLKFKIDKIAQNRHNGAVFCVPFPKLATTRKIAPTDQHFQHDFATLLHRFFASSEE